MEYHGDIGIGPMSFHWTETLQDILMSLRVSVLDVSECLKHTRL